MRVFESTSHVGGAVRGQRGAAWAAWGMAPMSSGASSLRSAGRGVLITLSFQVDRLLAVADFGPPDEKDEFMQNGFR